MVSDLWWSTIKRSPLVPDGDVAFVSVDSGDLAGSSPSLGILGGWLKP